jgi:transmembrane sensor
MKDSSSEKSDLRRLIEASAWRARLWEGDLETTPEFEAWLSDARNRHAWAIVQNKWNLIGEHATALEVLDLRRGALGRARGMRRQRWSTRYPWISRAAIAASIVLVAGVIALHLTAPDVYRTGAGERRVVTLTDGSQVQLDSLTELRVDYSERARGLTLVKGQARFDVARDARRPFWVVAADRKVVALGTAFNVDLLGKELFVTLLAGKVLIVPQVAELHLPAMPASAPPPAFRSARTGRAGKLGNAPLDGVELQAGQQLAVSAGGAEKVAPASVQRATAWQNGQLVFEDEPLSSVVARVNRYAVRPVVLADGNMASLRISGVFHTGDTDGFIATVTHFLPIEAMQGEEATYLRAR